MKLFKGGCGCSQPQQKPTVREQSRNQIEWYISAMNCDVPIQFIRKKNALQRCARVRIQYNHNELESIG